MIDSFRRITLPSGSKDLTARGCCCCCKETGGNGGGEVAPVSDVDELEGEARDRLNGAEKTLYATGGCGCVGAGAGDDAESG